MALIKYLLSILLLVAVASAKNYGGAPPVDDAGGEENSVEETSPLGPPVCSGDVYDECDVLVDRDYCRSHQTWMDENCCKACENAPPRTTAAPPTTVSPTDQEEEECAPGAPDERDDCADIKANGYCALASIGCCTTCKASPSDDDEYSKKPKTTEAPQDEEKPSTCAGDSRGDCMSLKSKGYCTKPWTHVPQQCCDTCDGHAPEDPPKPTEKSPKAPPTTKKSPKAPKTTEKAPKAPPVTEKSPKAPKTTEKAPKAQPVTEKSPKAPKTTEKSPKAPKTTEKSPKAPKTTEKSPKAPKATEKPASDDECVKKVKACPGLKGLGFCVHHRKWMDQNCCKICLGH